MANMKNLDKQDREAAKHAGINPRIDNFGKEEIFKADQKSKVPVEATMVKDSDGERKEIQDLMAQFKLKFFENKKVRENVKQLEKTKRADERKLDELCEEKGLVKAPGG